MTVWNQTVNNGGQQPQAITAVGLPTPSCGSVLALDSLAGATIPVPDEMVVYVAAAPGVFRRQCSKGEIGGPAGLTLPLGTYDLAEVPVPSETTSGPHYTYDTNMVETNRFCAEGNLYAEGIFKGRVMPAAAQ